MPIYEYRCEDCGHDLEALQGLSDDALVDCPECGKPSLRKRISASAFRLKGGGWYETDFKSGDRRNIAGDKDSKSGEKNAGDKGGDKSSGGEAKKSGSEGKSSDKSSSSSSTSKSGSGGAES